MRQAHAALSPTAPSYLRLGGGVLLIVAALLLMNDPAFAQAAGGSVRFGCSGGRAYGTLYNAAISCPTSIKIDNIFTFLVCNMERLSGNLLGAMYCSILQQLIPGVMGMLTLAVLFFGMGFTIGVIPATARDFQLFLLKIAFVAVFATQSDAIIGTGYNLLVTGMREGTAIGLSAMFPDTPATSGTGIEVYGYLDRFLAQVVHFATDYVGLSAAKGQNPCKNAVFAVLGIMAVVFPPIFLIGVVMMFRIAMTFLRAVFGYLYSVVGITFLLTLSPIFVSFYLFRATRSFFDKWLGYLVSFTLQMVILFAFLGFILSIDVSSLSNSFTSIIIQKEDNFETTASRIPLNYCTVCDFKVVDENGNDIGNSTQSGSIISAKGRLVCKDSPPKPIGALETLGPDQSRSIRTSLLKFATYGLLSLLILAYLVEYLLSSVGIISSLLASGLGSPYAPQLGGGESQGKVSIGLPGDALANTYETGFIEGYTQDQKHTAVASTVAGFKKAAERLAVGEQGTEQSGSDPGLVGTFTSFLLNPTRDPGN